MDRFRRTSAQSSLGFPVRVEVTQQLDHRRPECPGELVDGQDRRHPLAPLQQADVVAVEAGSGRERLLGEAGRQPPAPEGGTELSLEWMHGPIGAAPGDWNYTP
jgi:hypothetical protein